ncbi:cysteine proteinase [Piedraia hortae CBS 480.64]|uniref:Ubiquitin carboxyl-terminal hydrolase n=1 Tax=Piedraia hortae CBS 480.64 TaxID=1314780 RepID=A0A6A7C9V4_9PEZI|nr:cysteine proteinase [Piedraia hortae CBS 480.64]
MAITMAASDRPLKKGSGCYHVQRLMEAAHQDAVEGYTKIVKALKAGPGIATQTYRVPQTQEVRISIQPSYICLQCGHVSKNRERHIKQHPFAIESTEGLVYCYDCHDFVYHREFEEIRTGGRVKSARVNAEEEQMISSHTSKLPCSAVGLRGLYNMGQTCFMSVILQALLHNPLIRAYYLAEGHKSSECERETCTACALDDMFTQFYGDEKHEGYGAVNMLQASWKGDGGLAGYSQQDAHEYLGFILNSLHGALTEGDEENTSNRDCHCAIHQTFGGLLRSTVTCADCGAVNSTVDPFMDLSLDLKLAPLNFKKKKLPATQQTVKEILPLDLADCLGRFTGAETLGRESEYKCRSCASASGAKKHLEIERVPLVLPIHLKRFSHSRSLKESKKIDSKVRFPLNLDIAPYVVGGTLDSFSAADQGLQYTLSSVIVHKGKMDSGHYISYARQGPHEWFRFDDSMVVEVDEREVLGAEAYMLFYVNVAPPIEQ